MKHPSKHPSNLSRTKRLTIKAGNLSRMSSKCPGDLSRTKILSARTLPWPGTPRQVVSNLKQFVQDKALESSKVVQGELSMLRRLIQDKLLTGEGQAEYPN